MIETRKLPHTFKLRERGTDRYVVFDVVNQVYLFVHLDDVNFKNVQVFDRNTKFPKWIREKMYYHDIIEELMMEEQHEQTRN